MGRPEARNKDKVTDSCYRQRKGEASPLMRLKRKQLQKCCEKLSQTGDKSLLSTCMPKKPLQLNHFTVLCAALHTFDTLPHSIQTGLGA